MAEATYVEATEILVDETKRSDVSEDTGHADKGKTAMEEAFSELDAYISSAEWKGQAFDKFVAATQFLENHATNVNKTYDALKAAVDQLLDDVDNFTTNSAVVQKIKEG